MAMTPDERLRMHELEIQVFQLNEAVACRDRKLSEARRLTIELTRQLNELREKMLTPSHDDADLSP